MCKIVSDSVTADFRPKKKKITADFGYTENEVSLSFTFCWPRDTYVVKNTQVTVKIRIGVIV